MKQLNKPTDNMGGLIKIWAIPSDQVTVSGKTVTIASIENVYEIYCSEDSMSHNESSERTNAGTLYNTTIKGFAPGFSEELEKALEYMDPRKWVILFIDGNGNYKLAGNNTQPLRLTSSVDTGQSTSDRSGCEFIFYGNILERARLVNNPF